MTPERAEAITRVRAANRAVMWLALALRALGDTWAEAEADLCPAILTRLYKHLEAQEMETESEKSDGTEH